MESLTPIPTPASQRWREFRIQALPIITFLTVVVCIAVLWQRYVFPSNIVAQVEVTSVNIISTEPAIIESINVERFQRVKKGDIIATVTIVNTNLLAASLEGVRADLGVMSSRVEVGSLRAEQTYERERLSYLEQKVQWNTDKELLKLAEVRLKIAEDLLKSEGMINTNATGTTTNGALIPRQDYEIAFYNREALKVKVSETEQYLKEKEKTLPKLQYESTNSVTAIQNAIKAQENILRASATNIALVSPIDGVVTVVSNKPGERVMGGAPIAMISGIQADRIVAFMRQPIGAVPKPGDTLQVRRRTFKRQAATATVRDVGTTLEPITPALMAAGTTTIDLGLPFAINMPAQLNLLPGEIVDVIYDQRGR